MTTYRGWTITFEYGQYQAVSPNYDASYEGPEDGWVDNGQRVFADTLDDVCEAVNDWYDENEPCDCIEGKIFNNADPTSNQYVPCTDCTYNTELQP